MARPIIASALALLTIFSSNIDAQSIYKWQDENGKWQFSDMPPANSDTPVEKSNPNPVNTTTNTNRALKKVFPSQSAAETRYENQQANTKAQRSAAITQWCNQARKRLSIIEGKVVFLDEQGRALQVTEEEREARALALRKKIRKNCP